MSGPAVAVIGSLVSAYLAIHGADPVIDENYYQHGLEINRELAKQPASDPPLQPDLQPQSVRGDDEIQAAARVSPSRGH